MKKILFIGLLVSTLTACSSFLEEYSQDLSRVESVADLDELLLGDAYLQVGFYEQYNSSALQLYNLFIHFMSDELMQNPYTDNRFLSFAAPSSLFGYFTWQRLVELIPKTQRSDKKMNAGKRATNTSIQPT